MYSSGIAHVLFDIDDTLTRYRSHALDRILEGNFLFPLIADLAEESGIPRPEAERIISETAKKNVFWDYPDFLPPLGLSLAAALPVFRKWHAENMEVLPDAVGLVVKLTDYGMPVSVISNNPRLGCLLKLECCGLADAASGKSRFSKLLSTDLIRGCKGEKGVWKRALKELGISPDRIIAIGDNPEEDARLPMREGVVRCFLLERGVSAPLHLPPGVRRIRNAGEIANDPIFQDLFQKRNTVITEF